MIARDFITFLDRADAADFHADGGVEFQRIAARGGFRIAEHDTDLEADLIEENQQRIGFGNGPSQLAERLRHQARMQPDMAIAHFAFQFRARHQGGDGIHHQHINRAGTHQRIRNLKRLFAGIGLADQQIIHIHAKLPGIAGVERVFRVHKGAGAAALLRFRNHMQSERGFA